MNALDTFCDELIRGTVIERPNRFVLRVSFGSDSHPERVFLGDPGALEVVSPGSTVLCSPVADPSRKTDYDAIAVEADGIYVSLRAAFANTLFAEAVSRGMLSAFEGHEIRSKEPQLPEHGRSDFLLTPPSGNRDVFVEVKSCTHASDGRGKFPDRPTERGQRHLKSLTALTESSDTETHLVFVAQRPDVEVITPYREVDPKFTKLLQQAADAGVNIHGITTEFDPPQYLLRNPDVPIELDACE